MPRLNGNSVFVIGLGAVGAEIATSVSHACVKSLYLFDNALVSKDDCTDCPRIYDITDIGLKTRAEAVASLVKLSFPVVEVNIVSCNGSSSVLESSLANADIAVFTTSDRTELMRYNEYCRAQIPPICFMNACSLGLVGYTFVDYGKFDEGTPSEGQSSKSFRYCALRAEASTTVDLYERKIKSCRNMHTIVNGISSFVEENGFMPEYMNESHASQISGRCKEFLYNTEHDLTGCSHARRENVNKKKENAASVALEKLFQKVSFYTAVKFPPLVDFLVGSILGYIGHFVRFSAMMHNGSGGKKQLVPFPAAESPLTYYDATRIPVRSEKCKTRTLFIPDSIYATEDIFKKKYILFSDGLHLVEAVSALTRIGLGRDKKGKLMVVTSEVVADRLRTQISHAVASDFEGELMFQTFNNIDHLYIMFDSALVLLPRGPNGDLPLFVSNCKEANIDLLSSVIAPKPHEKHYTLFCTPTITNTPLSDKRSENSDDEEGSTVDSQLLNEFPWDYLRSLPEDDAPSKVKVHDEWDAHLKKALELFEDKFLNVASNVIDITLNGKKFVKSMNNQGFARPSRYFDQISSIATVLSLASSPSSAQVSIEHSLALYQTTFPFLIKDDSMKTNGLIIRLKENFIQSASKLFLYLTNTSNEDEVVSNFFAGNKFIALERDSPVYSAKVYSTSSKATDSKDSENEISIEMRCAIVSIVSAFENIKESSEPGDGHPAKLDFKSLVRDLKPTEETLSLCQAFVEASCELFLMEQTILKPNTTKVCQLEEEEKAFIRSEVKRFFGFEESLKSAKSYFASAMLSLETFLTWSHDVTLPCDEQNNINTCAFLATFESYEDILNFQRPIEPVVFQPADYLSSKVKQRFQKGRKMLLCGGNEI
eukprot:Stramenopile-MAST_4_protein_1051